MSLGKRTGPGKGKCASGSGEPRNLNIRLSFALEDADSYTVVSVKKLITAAFGFQVILGNICLMNVAFAAEGPGHVHGAHEPHDDQCMEMTCLAQEEDSSSMPQSCPEGNCIMPARADLEALEPQMQELPAAPAFLPLLITQALLVLGPPDAPPDDVPRIPFSSVTTVVLRR